MAGLFDLLPNDLKREEIFSRLDPCSRMVLHHTIHRIPFPERFPYQGQKAIVASGLNLMVYFWDRLDNEYLCGYAAGAGKLDCLKYAHKNGCRLDTSIIDAVCSGSLDCIQYVLDNGCRLNNDLVCVAAGSGHLNILKYLYDLGYSGNVYACILAAELGRLDCLKYLHENGCPLNYPSYYRMLSPVNTAAARGHLECLKYAHENGCRLDSNTCDGLMVPESDYGGSDMVFYSCKDYGLPEPKGDREACRQYLIDNKYPGYERLV